MNNAVALHKDEVRQMNNMEFCSRHIGPRDNDIQEMLSLLGLDSLEQLIEKTIPQNIRLDKGLKLTQALTENELLDYAREIASKNKTFKSFIGLGFHDTHTPSVILRTILENPCWYTQYTPYQAEISQGRLEAIVNFQTLIAELTGMDLANSSLLDEGSALAEAMTLSLRVHKNAKSQSIFLSDRIHKPTIEVVKTRAKPLGINVEVGDINNINWTKGYFAIALQYPGTEGDVADYTKLAVTAKTNSANVLVATDLLALTLLKPPGEWGADIVVGNSQRYGVPMGFGGPHAAFIACKDEFKRELPGRIVGVSKDAEGNVAYRLALQTREQHIRREKATSNICTAQVLLAIMASMYAVYHGPNGLKKIAAEVNKKTIDLANKIGLNLKHQSFFDTITTAPLSKDEVEKIKTRALEKQYNFRYNDDNSITVALDQGTTDQDIKNVVEIFSAKSTRNITSSLPKELERTSSFLSHPVFNSYHSETELLRYITRLQNKDLSLAVSMIPLGSCTMKLNAATEMLPITWKEFAALHPFCPEDQSNGYKLLERELATDILEITGLAGVSFQPNAGSQGEYAGLLAISAYFQSLGQINRNICLIPQSAHGTNPASAALAGMKVVVTKCDEQGNVDLEDLKQKAAQHKDSLAALMITYPSTHGVFEENIVDICKIIHDFGGQVYMDGANMNAQVGLCRPGDFGVDVCHLNLHKTFCIPHGGGGPGVGPVVVAKHLVKFLPNNDIKKESAVGPVATGPIGSAAILPIPWAYIKMMGEQGLKKATEIAILNANYIAKRLEGHFDVLYKGKNGTVAHECILDLRKFKRTTGIEVADVAKRLMDYGFHAPTVSFPVVETLMVEPTESESKEELDRFCDALIQIRKEIADVEDGKSSKENNLVKNAPHTVSQIASEKWDRPYTREQAVYPLAWVKERKFWPAVARVDNSYGDRNLFCSCAPIIED